MEKWLPVVGYEGLYEISDLGRVKSLPRPYVPKEKIRKLTTTGDGYHIVCLCKGGITKSYRIHKLVAEAFIGPCPVGLEVRHGDSDPGNNALTNLTYGTHSQNMLDKVARGTHHEAKKTHCPQGHEYTEENTRLDKDGYRHCRACKRKPYRHR